MSQVVRYILGMCCCAVACNMLITTIPKGSNKTIIKLLCGMFVIFTLLMPFADWSIIKEIEIDFDEFDASEAVQIGKEYSRDSISDIIRKETEAYIVKKAAEWNIDLKANVNMSSSDTPIPEGVEIVGAITPQEKTILIQFLEKELGITKEFILWSN